MIYIFKIFLTELSKNTEQAFHTFSIGDGIKKEDIFYQISSKIKNGRIRLNSFFF